MLCLCAGAYVCADVRCVVCALSVCVLLQYQVDMYFAGTPPLAHFEMTPS